MADYNPLKSVDGASVPCPSSYSWQLYDVSSSDAGETEDVTMHKKRIAQKTKIELEWVNIPAADVTKIVKAFNPEYVTVNYYDLLTGGYKTEVFYVGDRVAPAYNTRKGLWSVSFNIVGRKKRG